MNKNIIYTLALVLLFKGALYPSGNIGTSGADFLELGIGSRPLGMGEAFSAQLDDINSIYYNPAGLGSMKYPLLTFQHQELIVDSRLDNVSFCYPLYDGFIGLSNTVFWVPPFDKIDLNGEKIDDAVFFSGALTAAYGYNLDFMYVGGSIKYIYQRADTLITNAAAIDIGILKGFYMYSPFDAPIRNFHVGLSLQNIGTPVEGDPLPRLLRFGVSYQLTRWFGLNVDFVENFIEAGDLYDFTYGFDESFRINTGFEITYLDILYMRGGWRFNDAGTYTIGVGFNYVVKNVTFNIDTSYSDSGIFGPVYSFNVSFKLIPKVITIDDVNDADVHYNQGIKYFVANDIDAAINEFKTCRDYDPYHKNINKKIKDLEEIKSLQKQVELLDQENKE